ncbi:zinc finger protein ZFP2-like [Eublepharis macularius]|uniref:Zinc finger protein ZFP2-like n=1 Tax=Eublepharis macularius TaxID=481883 RepID=A0AA97J7I4_EUBMA|nr:zinc finger protein ZFP2-like [Eublepharis macularius]
MPLSSSSCWVELGQRGRRTKCPLPYETRRSWATSLPSPRLHGEQCSPALVGLMGQQALRPCTTAPALPKVARLGSGRCQMAAAALPPPRLHQGLQAHCPSCAAALLLLLQLDYEALRQRSREIRPALRHQQRPPELVFHSALFVLVHTRRRTRINPLFAGNWTSRARSQGAAMQRLLGADDVQLTDGEKMNLPLGESEQSELNGALASKIKGSPEIQEAHGSQHGLENCGDLDPVRKDSLLGGQSSETAFCGRGASGTDSLESWPSQRRKKQFVCSECGRTFSRSSTLANHRTTHTGEKPHQCLVCGKCFGYKALLLRHGKSHSKEKPYKRLDCGKTFSYNTVLSIHERNHTGEKLYTCSECGRSFDQKTRFVKHWRTHNPEKMFPCLECDKSFASRSTLSAHQRSHTGEKPYECSECGKTFSQKSHLTIHNRTHTGEKPHSCLRCGHSFSRKFDLLLHERTHTGEKPYRCSECGKSFCQSSQLFVHRRIHTGEKPFKCLECGKSFRWESSLKMHAKIHAGDRPYACSDCGKSYTRSYDFIRHTETHTGMKPHKCSDCGKRFSNRSILVEHKRIHTGEKPFKCSVCGKSFSQKSNRNTHMRIHIRGDPGQNSEKLSNGNVAPVPFKEDC